MPGVNLVWLLFLDAVRRELDVKRGVQQLDVGDVSCTPLQPCHRVLKRDVIGIPLPRHRLK